jgi:hypothetical protein
LIPPANHAVNVFGKEISIPLAPFFMVLKVILDDFVGVARIKKNFMKSFSSAVKKMFKVFQKKS